MELDPAHALVVLSGGQDSTTCLGYALENYDKVSCVTFDYGQRHSIEIDAANKVRAFFEERTGRTIAHLVVKLAPDTFAGMSPLTDPEQDLETYDSAEQMNEVIGARVELTFVPMRNAVFLMIAANRAVVMGAGVLVTGVCQQDNANYPDCREVFIENAAFTINTALGLDTSLDPEFYVDTPLINLTKAQSIDMALQTPHTYHALAYSHTAYDGKYPPTGKDHASTLRADGFVKAGVPDPLVMRAVSEGLMEMPISANYDLHRTFRSPK